MVFVHDVEVPKILRKVAYKCEKIWEDNYRSWRKFNLIDDVLEDFTKRNKKWKAYADKRAISTHLSIWLGWKRIRSIKHNTLQYQYRLPWHSGYVYAIIFEKRRERNE